MPFTTSSVTSASRHEPAPLRPDRAREDGGAAADAVDRQVAELLARARSPDSRTRSPTRGGPTRASARPARRGWSRFRLPAGASSPDPSRPVCARARAYSFARVATALSTGYGRPPALLVGRLHARLRALPRRGVGAAGHGRPRPLRAHGARGLPVRPLVAHDPAQARELPRGVRRLRDRRGGALRRARRGRACSRTPASSATAARSRPRSRTRKAARAMRVDGESLAELIWSFAPSGRRRAPRTLDDLRRSRPSRPRSARS